MPKTKDVDPNEKIQISRGALDMLMRQRDFAMKLAGINLEQLILRMKSSQ